MASNAYYRALMRARGATLRSSLSDRFAENARTRTATVLEGGQVKVGNQRYTAEGVSGSAVGATVAVRNIGTRANAIYAPDAGDSLAFGSAGSSGSSGGGGGASTFLDLTDTFSSYSGLAGKFVKVDAGPSGLTAAAIADGDLPATLVRTSRTISAGTGLTGGGDLSANRSFAVDVNALFDPLYALTAPSGRLRVNLITESGLEFLSETAAIRVDAAGNNRTTAAGDTRVATYSVAGERSLGIKLPSPSGLDIDATGLSIADTIAGAGLAIASKVLSVGAGNGIAVAADSIAVSLASPAGLGFTGGALELLDSVAGDGLSISSKVLSINLAEPAGLTLDLAGELSVADTLAGAGLTIASKVMAVGAGNGIEVSADATAVKLGSPSGLTFSGGALVVADTLAGNGLSISSKVMAINLASPSGLVIASDALAISDTIAGDGLDISAKVLSVDTGDGLEIFTGAVRVDEDFAFEWTARHRWGSVGSIDPSFAGMFINSGDPDGSAALRVSSADVADLTLYLKQISGQTASLIRVEDAGGDALILLSDEGNLESGQPGFVSGLTGWRISATGDAEFNNIVARGEFHASTFVMDEMLVSNGTQFIGTGGKLLNVAYSTNDAVEYTRVTASGDVRVTASGDTRIVDSAIFALDIEDPESGHAQVFERGDALRVKNWDGDNDLYDNWVVVNGVTDVTDYFRYWVRLASGTPGELPAGAAVVSYGQNGDGRLLLTSDLANAPYLDIFTVGAEPWAGDIAPNVRLGQLSGVGLAGSSQFGIIAGRDLSSTSLDNPYFLLSDQGARLHNLRLTLYDGARTWVDFDPDALMLTMGTDTGSAAGRLLRLDANAGTMQIGNSANPAAVTVYGQIVIDDSGANNAATKTDVSTAQTAAQNYADGVAAAEAAAAEAAAEAYAANIASSEADAAQAAAQAYADTLASTAQTNAQSYANGRRVLAVDIAWTIADANTVTWATGSLRMGDGSTVTIAATGTTGDMVARVYIYWRPGENSLRQTTSISSMAAGDVLIAIAEPGSDKANLTVVGGRTYISGDWINTGAITANQIKAGTITATNIAAGTITAAKIAAGTITANEIAANTITAAKIAAGTITADEIAAGTITGDEISATATIVAGSGNDIAALNGADATWRIYAGHATPASAPFRVTKAGKLYATGAEISGDITVTGGNAATQTYVDTAATEAFDNAVLVAASYASTAADVAQAYAEARRVTGVTGTWTATDTNTVAWTSVTLTFGTGTTQAITNGNTGDMPSGRNYIYWRIGESTFRRVTTPSTNVEDVLIAIAQPGTDKANIQVLAGATLISGDWINTGSITAQQIKANTITAALIAADTITANEIAAGTITATELAADSVTAAKIQAGAITADKIAAGTITADKIASGTITGSLISASTKITAGSDNDIAALDGSDATYRIYAGNSNPASAPFRVTKAGALTATSANISGYITATNMNITGAASVGADLIIGGGGRIYSGASDWASGTGYYLEYNSGTPRAYIGSKSGGALSKGFQWDGSDFSLKAQDTNAVSLLGVNTGGAGLITVNMRQSSGVAGEYDYGLYIDDGGNTSSGVSALYHGQSNQGNAVDRIFNAITYGSAKSDGFFATMASGIWNGGDSSGVGFKGAHAGGGVVALFNQTGSGLNAPTVWASSVQWNVGIYEAKIGGSGQTAFKVDNTLGGTPMTALQAAGGYIDDVGPIRMRSQGAPPANPGGGYIYIYQTGNQLYFRTSSGQIFAFNFTYVSG